MATKLLIFGITGDLSTRKLLPALQQITTVGEFSELQIYGVSRSVVDANSFAGNLAERISMITMNVSELGEYQRLKDELNLHTSDQLLIYLSVPPRAATQIVDFLGESGLNGKRVKILFEKPFGLDLDSAHEMVERTARYFNESQIYRIDHYMAKEMAQNIVAFRAYNALFARVWNNQAIEKIEINAFENIDIEGRAHFYEQTGALRDVVQGHLLQLLALILMDIPAVIDWNMLPEYRLEALKQVRPASSDYAVRAQYEGYTEEVDTPHSCVETFVSMELESNSQTWQGVPIILTTGKALDKKSTEIKVYFRQINDNQTDYLTFRIQPNEGIEMTLNTKRPGYDNQLDERHLAFNYPEDIDLPDAYEQVIVDAIRSRKSLFTSSGEMIRAWEILQPLVDSWSMCPKDTILRYKKGTPADKIITNQAK